ncbi:MAG: FG-GAP repeat protein [Pseudomonadota bacterium]
MRMKRTERAERVEYQRAGVSEWYQRGARGVEQGFTLSEAPCGDRDVELDVAVEGLRPQLAVSGDGVELIDQSGVARMHYTDLSARDELGRALPATMSVEEGRIALRVAVGGVTFPVVIDPEVWSAGTSLIGDQSGVFDEFGGALAISGDTALVGAANETVAGKAAAGALFAFVRNGSTWSQQGPALTPNEVAAGDRVGGAVAISGDTALVGASYTVVGGNWAQGAAYVFLRSGSSWQQQGPALISADGGVNDGFGQAVAISGDSALIGAPGHLGANATLGAVYAFARTAGTWQPLGVLIPTDAGSTDLFGISVAISGDTALVGASNKIVAGNDLQGAAYVFVRSGGSWQQQGPALIAADGQPNDAFGFSVALSGETALIGATARHAAYVFTRTGTTWTQQGDALIGSGNSTGSQFGCSVALSGDTALIGARLEAEGGTAYVFTRSGATWTQQGPPLIAPEATFSFGAATALSGDTALVGTPNGTPDAAYVFERGPCAADSGCCTVDSDCPPDRYCPAYGICQPKLSQGALCTAATNCNTGFCVEGFCCDSACSGRCVSCSGALSIGASGSCLPIRAGSDPDDECAPDPEYPSSCGADGSCDGNGACRSFAPSGTVCGAVGCHLGSEIGQLCDGAGSCSTNTVACAPYICTDAGCLTSCAGDLDCTVGQCVAGICEVRKPLGQSCSQATECASSSCVDGVCCDSSCSGSCQACAEKGKKGQCTLISGDPRPGHAACKGDPMLCGGTCDGTDMDCQYRPSGIVCQQACVAGQGMFGSCDGRGTCRSQLSASICGAYACGENQCLESCAADRDCVNGARCVESQCLTPHESRCNADHRSSILADSSVVQCAPYRCDDSRGTCFQECRRDADCATGNDCNANGQCGPSLAEPGAAGASQSDQSSESSQSSASCGCRIGTFGQPRSALAACLFLLLAWLRRRHMRRETHAPRSYYSIATAPAPYGWDALYESLKILRQERAVNYGSLIGSGHAQAETTRKHHARGGR